MSGRLGLRRKKRRKPAKIMTVILDYLGSRPLAHEDSTEDYLFWSYVNFIPYQGVDPSLGCLPYLHCSLTKILLWIPTHQPLTPILVQLNPLLQGPRTRSHHMIPQGDGSIQDVLAILFQDHQVKLLWRISLNLLLMRPTEISPWIILLNIDLYFPIKSSHATCLPAVGYLCERGPRRLACLATTVHLNTHQYLFCNYRKDLMGWMVKQMNRRWLNI